MAKNGNIILVGLNGAIVAGAKSCELSIDGETIEISTATIQTARTFIAGRTSWQVTFNYLVTSFTSIKSIGGSTIATLLSVGNTYTLSMGERNGATIGSNSVSGSAILTSLRITATRGNLIQGSIVFKGSGPLTI